MPNSTFQTLRAIEERWQSLTIANDFVFCKAMLDTELCREVLEAILGIDIDRVEYAHPQEQLNATPENKSVRLDVYVRDESGTVFDVEMQATNTHELPQRSRYYHAMLTLDQLERGALYKSLKDSYVVFICSFDPFGEGRRVYYFENTCRNSAKLPLGDGTKTVFLSATSPRQDSDDVRLNELLDYVAFGEVSGTLSAKLAAAVANVLDNQKWRLEYMMLEVRDQLNYDRGVLIGRKEGMAEGIKQGRQAGLSEGIEQGRQAGLSEGIEQGRQAGLTEGQERGEARFALLASTLVQDGRADAIARASSDLAYRSDLYKEYGIE